MKVGDLIKIRKVFTTVDYYEFGEHTQIAMIIEGPNEVGKLKALLSDGKVMWLHCTEVEYLPRERSYLKQ
jgi:hypothetical protein